MARSATLVVKIISDATGAAKGFAAAESNTAKFERRLGSATKAAKISAVAIGLVGVAAFKQASDLQQADGAVQSVFKNQSDAVRKLAKDAADSLGLARSEYSQMAAVFGAQLKNMGVSVDQLVPKTADLIKLGGDLAATYGGKTSTAVQALSSLLRGERDPIEQYGVSIKQADINARLAAQGQDKLTGAAKRTAETEATLALLYQQTADAVGQRSRESETAAVKQEESLAKIKNAGADLGKVLLPIFASLSGSLSGMAGFISENQTTFTALTAALLTLSVAVFTVNAAYKVYTAGVIVATAAQNLHLVSVARNVASYIAFRAVLVATAVIIGVQMVAAWVASTAATVASTVATAAHAVVMGVVRGAVVAWTVAQAALNVVLAANPIALVIIAVLALVAGIVLAYRKSETFRTIVQAVGKAAAAAFQWVVDKAKELWDRIQKLGPIASRAKDIAVAAFRAYTSPIRFVIDLVKSLINWIRRIDFPSPPGWVSGLFGGFGALPAAAPHGSGSRSAYSTATGRGGPGGSGGFLVPIGSSGGVASITVNVNNAIIGSEADLAQYIERLLRRRLATQGVAL